MARPRHENAGLIGIRAVQGIERKSVEKVEVLSGHGYIAAIDDGTVGAALKKRKII
jgi:hypothetical protein